MLNPFTDTHSLVPLALDAGQRVFLLSELNQPSNGSQLGPMTWDQNSEETSVNLPAPKLRQMCRLQWP